MHDTKEVMGLTVNKEAVGSNPTCAATQDWNEEEGILTLQEFRPEVPASVSIGLVAARDPEKKRTLKKVFLEALQSTGLVTEASKICQIPKSLAFQWRMEDPEFQTRWDMTVKGQILPHLEAEAIRRAMNGSDLLLMFMLKAIDRERFDDKAAEKVVARPSIVVQIRDVDRTLIAISDTSKVVPAIEYKSGKLLDAKENSSADIVDAEYVKSDGEAASRNGPITSTEKTGKE